MESSCQYFSTQAEGLVTGKVNPGMDLEGTE